MKYKLIALPGLALLSAAAAMAADIYDLRINTLKNPQGVDSNQPAFSWKINSAERGVSQVSYEIKVTDDNGAEVWSSGSVLSGRSAGVLPEGLILEPSKRYFWSVSVTDNKGEVATSTEKAYFDTGLLDSWWSGARWISPTSLPYGSSTEQVKNYVVEFDFEVEHAAAGFCFGSTDTQNFYMWQFKAFDASNPVFRPHVWRNGAPALLDEIPLKDKIAIKTGTTYHTTIEVTNGGAHCRTLIDGVVIDERDGDFPYGAVGMRQDYTDIDMKPEIGLFDNIVITSADSGTKLYSEDFSGSNGFTAGEQLDGRLRVVGSTTGSVYAWQAPERNDPYTVEYDMTLVDGNAAIIFASTGTVNYYMWQLNTSDTDGVLLRRHVYNNSSNPWFDNVQVNAFSKADMKGKTHHWRHEIDGSKVTTFIDDVKIDEFNSQFGNVAFGKIGLRVDNTSTVNEEAYFDNILVTVRNAAGDKVVLSEDFETGSSQYFYSADVESIDNNYVCHMVASGAENRMLQITAEGEPLFFTYFNADKDVESAYLHTSALGVYDLFLNGERVGHRQLDGSMVYDELKPGWTDYRRRVFYTTHNVTDLCRKGENSLGAVVTSGWWTGAVNKGFYGSNKVAFMAKLVVRYTDGTEQVIVSDPTWACATSGPLMLGDIYDGEIYDGRRSMPWADNDPLSAHNAVAESNYSGSVDAYRGPNVRTLDGQRLKAVKVDVSEGVNHGSDFGTLNVVESKASIASLSLKKGQTAIVDFGQNFAGWPEFTVKGKPGVRLHLRFAEMLNDTGERSRANDGPGGSLYLENLRSAKAELFYTLGGNPAGETYHPSTTFYGYRYCEVTATDDVEIVDLAGVPISSSNEQFGSVVTDNEMVNRLFSNIVWGQRSNLISVPTDCPQRDERLGWTADTQVFSNTAMLNANVTEFYRKWLTDMRDSQREDGAYYDIAPVSWTEFGNGAWADAGVIVSWNVYTMTGDKSFIEESYASMEKFMDWLSRQQASGYKYPGGGTAHGDWLSFAATDSRLVSIAYYAYDALLMSRMSKILSESEGDAYALAAEKYENLYNAVKAEFQSKVINARKGTLRNPTQTLCVMMLYFDLCKDEAQRDMVIDKLNELIEANGNKLNTGFVGTAYLNTALSDNGLSDKAYNLLLQRDCPSWLYSIDQGATTMWERWNSYTKESGFGDKAMNSFNHYAYGAVGEWMYRNMTGIAPSEANPGFEEIIYAPCPDLRESVPAGQDKIKSAKGEVMTPYGLAKAAWTLSDGDFTYSITVPANAVATVKIPVKDENSVVNEGSESADKAEGVEFDKYENGRMVYKVKSGDYVFSTGSLSSVKPVVADRAALRVYPNPAQSTVNVASAEPLLSVKVLSMAGKLMLNETSPVGTIDVSHIAPGLYLLVAETPSGITTAKLIKE